jgi:hypothetical protein
VRSGSEPERVCYVPRETRKQKGVVGVRLEPLSFALKCTNNQAHGRPANLTTRGASSYAMQLDVQIRFSLYNRRWVETLGVRSTPRPTQLMWRTFPRAGDMEARAPERATW